MVHGAGPMTPRSPTRPATDAPPPAEPLGDFSIVRGVGRGGMGVLYEAVQLSLGRRVVLKVLPFAAALDARLAAVFKNEAQAAAQPHDTNIVPVYAVGCERGTHYYAMQLDRGAKPRRPDRSAAGRGPATCPDPALCARGSTGSYHPASGGVYPHRLEEYRRDDPGRLAGGRSHRPRARGRNDDAALHASARFYRTAAGIAVQAADALEHAHQFGVVHRDVKPANLIVDERGNVWVTDFGLRPVPHQPGPDANRRHDGDAALHEPRTGGRPSRRARRAPDVYSLGATFY